MFRLLYEIFITIAVSFSLEVGVISGEGASYREKVCLVEGMKLGVCGS